MLPTLASHVSPAGSPSLVSPKHCMHVNQKPPSFQLSLALPPSLPPISPKLQPPGTIIPILRNNVYLDHRDHLGPTSTSPSSCRPIANMGPPLHCYAGDLPLSHSLRTTKSKKPIISQRIQGFIAMLQPRKSRRSGTS